MNKYIRGEFVESKLLLLLLLVTGSYKFIPAEQNQN